MTNTNITNFRKHLFEYVNLALDVNDVINVNTRSGNVVLMSEEEYNGIMETLRINSSPEYKRELLEAMKEPIEEGKEYDPEEEW